MTIKYPSISQFKNIIRQVKDSTYYIGKDEGGNPIFDQTLPLPTLKFVATVKLHGTNAGIRLCKDGEIVPQSRERDLSMTSDNAGFWMYVNQHKEFFKEILTELKMDYDRVVIYGEWAGKGIQKGVAISDVDKKFFVFGVKIISEDDSVKWIQGKDLLSFPSLVMKNIDQLHANDVYLITEFETWEFDVDFNRPEMSTNKFVELVDRVEKECPVGKAFGSVGVGEGVVLSHHSDKYGLIQFKCKGEKHSNSKVKTTAPVDELAFVAAREFAENYVTESRLAQGINVLTSEHQLDMTDTKNIGEFLKWVSSDIFKEENQSIIDNNLDPKKIAKEVQRIARNWFLNRV